MKRTAGFTLPEVILALSIGIFLVNSIMALYAICRKNYRFTQNLMVLQENAVGVVKQMRKDIQQAGLLGCGCLNDVEVVGEDNGIPLQSNTAMQVFSDQSNTWTSLQPFLNKSVMGSDVLFLQEAEPYAASVYAISGNLIQLTGSSDLHAGETILLSDCQQAQLLKIQTASARGRALLVNDSPLFKGISTGDWEVRRFHQWVYWVGMTARKNQSGDPIPALYRVDLNNPDMPSEWVENIEKILVEQNNGLIQLQVFFETEDRVRLKKRLAQIWEVMIAPRERNG